MKDKAYAKVNLALDVFNIRVDGYHDLKSIMVPVEFYDEIEIEISDEDSFECNKTFLRLNEHNSIYKMITAFKDKFNISDCYSVKLKKSIPTQAGLGGGTSDGACTLRILEKLYDKKLSDEEAKELCVKVGSDVLFSYYNKPAIVEGVGDIVKPFEIRENYFLLLIKPRSGVSTRQAYELLDMDLCDHPDIEKLKQALINGDKIDGLLSNSLEQPALIINKDVARIKEELKNLSAENILMTGSGSCVFAIDKDVFKIKNLTQAMKEKGYFVRYTKILKDK